MPRSDDEHIGKRIRQRRHALGLSQKEVAGQIGVQFQQLQKYETGGNRISGSRIYYLAQALNVSPGYFFEGLGDSEVSDNEIKSANEAALLKGFRKISSDGKNAVLNLVAFMTNVAPNQPE